MAALAPFVAGTIERFAPAEHAARPDNEIRAATFRSRSCMRCKCRKRNLVPSTPPLGGDACLLCDGNRGNAGQRYPAVRTSTLFALAAFATLAACWSNAPRGAFVPAADHTIAAAKTPIRHVVFVIQENRSFNNLFFGYPGAKTAKYGYDTNGHRI